MSHRKRRNVRGFNGQTFLTLHHWMLRAPAFQSLTGNAVKLLIVLASRFNGHNNGEIFCSIRDAAREVKCSPNHAVKLFGELVEKGFVAVVQKGAFNLKTRHASTYRLTWLPVRRTDDPRLMHDATKEFMRWQSDNADAASQIKKAVAPETTVSRTP